MNDLQSVILSLLPTWALRAYAYAILFSFLFNWIMDRYVPHTDLRWASLMTTHPRLAGLISFLRAFPAHPPGMFRSLVLMIGKRKPDAVLEAIAGKTSTSSAPLLMLLFCGALAGATSACGGAPAELVKIAKASNRIVVASEPCLAATHAALVDECIEVHTTPTSFDDVGARSCVESLGRDWESLAEAFDLYRDARCRLEPAKCPKVPR